MQQIRAWRSISCAKRTSLIKRYCRLVLYLCFLSKRSVKREKLPSLPIVHKAICVYNGATITSTPVIEGDHQNFKCWNYTITQRVQVAKMDFGCLFFYRRDYMETIRVIIVDEQPLFREGIRATLERMGDCVILGESTDAAEVLEMARASNPDVALIDAGLITSDPLEIARQLRHIAPRMAIIILTPSEDEERLFQSIKVGAAAYYTRNITPDELAEAVRKVSHGEYLINDDVLSKPQLASRVLKSFRELTVEEEDNGTRDLYSPLSSREVEILDYIARGNSNKEIAKSLKISDQTVKNHITSILKKLSVNDRTAAVVHALRHGWIKMHDS